ncbi:hypothetical protein [Methylobacterium sp. SI9]|uniref:hypothetical protein n=1 Tax=Methylobacterium guangdongense TaxID=3138811 RepID=UPI00313BE7B0
MPPPAIARPDGLDIVLLVGSNCRLVNETLAAGDRDANAYRPVLDNPIAVRGSRILTVSRDRARPKRASPDDTIIVVPEADRNAA